MTKQPRAAQVHPQASTSTRDPPGMLESPPLRGQDGAERIQVSNLTVRKSCLLTTTALLNPYEPLVKRDLICVTMDLGHFWSRSNISVTHLL